MRYPLLTILVTILIILAGCNLISNPTRDEQYATIDELCAIAYLIHYDVRNVNTVVTRQANETSRRFDTSIIINPLEEHKTAQEICGDVWNHPSPE